MRRSNFHLLIPILFIAASSSVETFAAEATPIGVWKTVDDDTGEPKSLVRIVDVNGELRGTIEKVFSPPAKKPDPICEKCEGERKDKPVVGMNIMSGLKKSGDLEWSGGEILDPANGKTYRCKVTVIEDGKKLEMRGYVAFFYRTQTWLREE
ncbi:MAG: hypothetical protein A2W18_07960 [Candidatus Muproteobacteria bacterium RBG_16_60_9]|uniref:DUF2147 domain-containing protein n=1 Tax=Candidatus Muproteobacteria bacterium RBG_16_60_9 TaxID=1817755 RepID=A0A1F6V8M3_9PROT|nr:MAG: hypothetical protein A2W18_07960 [Candidatus Muproteobacteria bacterium RBG_16_60_9]